MLRVGIFSALSVATAYMIGNLAPLWIDPIVASIIALIAMRPTFHDAMKEGFTQVAGTLAGALMGILMIDAFGMNVATLSILVVLSFMIAWILKIGEEGAMAIGVTVILISGPLLGDLQAIEGRLFGVLVGATVALIFSYFILQGKPYERVVNDVLKQQKIIAGILKDVSNRISEGHALRTVTSQWINKINNSIITISEIKEEANSALEGSKWSPLMKKEKAEAALAQVEMTELTASSIYSIVVDVQRYFGNNTEIPKSNREALSEILANTAEVIVNQADKAYANPAVKISSASKDLLIMKKKKAANKLKDIDNTQVIILGGSILSDATKIRDIFSE
jgi:uncharacterized membrane protein YgaE (UPF0421/DUF939 family)